MRSTINLAKISNMRDETISTCFLTEVPMQMYHTQYYYLHNFETFLIGHFSPNPQRKINGIIYALWSVNGTGC